MSSSEGRWSSDNHSGSPFRWYLRTWPGLCSIRVLKDLKILSSSNVAICKRSASTESSSATTKRNRNHMKNKSLQTYISNSKTLGFGSLNTNLQRYQLFLRVGGFQTPSVWIFQPLRYHHLRHNLNQGIWPHQLRPPPLVPQLVHIQAISKMTCLSCFYHLLKCYYLL